MPVVEDDLMDFLLRDDASDGNDDDVSLLHDLTDNKDPVLFRALPPLDQKDNKKRKLRRPLCTFLNFRGTRLMDNSDVVSEVSSIPSLDDEESYKRSSSGASIVSYDDIQPKKKRPRTLRDIAMPVIDPRLKDDAKLQEMKTKLDDLVNKVKETRCAMAKYEAFLEKDKK